MHTVCWIGARWNSLRTHIDCLRDVDLRLSNDIDYVEKVWAGQIIKLEAEELHEISWTSDEIKELNVQLVWCQEAMQTWDEGGRGKIFEKEWTYEWPEVVVPRPNWQSETRDELEKFWVKCSQEHIPSCMGDIC